MNRKILLGLIPAVMIMAVSASAEDLGKYTVPGAEPGDTVYAAFYDENGVLTGGVCTTVDEELSIELPADVYRVRASKAGEESFSDIYPQASASPEATAAPEATPEATASPAPSLEPTAAPEESFPPIYGKEVDANRAPIIIRSVSETVNAEGENVYTAEVLYQGREGTLELPADITISAPEIYADKNGRDASALEEGDVIYCTSTFSRKITGIHLIFSAPEEDLVTSGEDYGSKYEELFTENGRVAGQAGWTVYGSGSDHYQYAFGMIGDKSSGLMSLYNSDGELIHEIAIEPGAVVYVCDTAEGNEVSISSSGGVVASSIPSQAFDEEGSIAISDEYVYNYALVRFVDGVATDIVVYLNYNE